MKEEDLLHQHNQVSALRRDDRTVASERSYEGATDVVNRLADSGFPVERVTIVGRGLSIAQHVVRRRTAAGAAANGAISGAAVGGLLAFVFGLFTVVEAGLGLGLMVWGITIGAIVGAFVGLVEFSLRGSRRFATLPSLEANRYDVVVDADVAREAERILGGRRADLPTRTRSDPEPSTTAAERVR